MQKLLLKDYDKIKKYLDDGNYEGYNSNFVTMMMWDHEYKIYYEIKDNFILLCYTHIWMKSFLQCHFVKKNTIKKQLNI